MRTSMHWRQRQHLRVVLGLALLIGGGAVASLRADDWPEWRGKGRRGVWNETGIVDTLPAQLQVKWRVPINSGFSGPSVANGRVFVTDVNQPRGKRVVERLLALDENTGKTLWAVEWDADYTSQVDFWAIGPVATPTVDEDRVYVVGRAGNLLALNVADGRVLWQKNYTADFGTIIPLYGTTSAPVVEGNRLIAHVGGANNSNWVAFDKMTGAEIWRARSSDPEPGYNQPMIIEAGGVRQLIAWDPNAVSGLDPATGRVYWEVPLPVQLALTIITPVQAGPYLFVASQYTGGLMLKLNDVKPGATRLWFNDAADDDTINPSVSTPVIDGNYIYGFSSFGSLRGLEAETGKVVWETQAVTKERAIYASALFVRQGDRYFFNNDRGELIIAKLSPRGYEEISRSPLITPNHPQLRRRALGMVVHWSHPAYANRHLITRNTNEIIRVSLAKEASN